MIQHSGRPRSESLQQVVRRILRASARASAPVAYAAGAVFAQGVAAPAHADPVLPTPCVGASCGTPGGNLPFVQSGIAGAATVGNAMTVTQSSDKAILNWKDFNIGAGHSVTFKQPASTSAALNRIWSATPSNIAGQLTANGQVYLINQSGIVFAKGAQINVGGLVASTLNLSDASFRDGLLSGNTDALKAGSRLPAVFDAGPNAEGTAGQVQVESGAQITAANGGRVLLAGSSVGNKGTIATPDGQTILAAGQKVYLASTADPTMRGLLVEVDAGGAGGSAAPSSVTNAGKIAAARGNVTLAGLAVNQAGILNATSSVSANGSIYLIAGDTSRASDGGVQLFYNDKVKGYDSAQNQSAITQGQLLPNNGGTLTLAPGSVTEITPDASDTATINDAQAFYTSQINLVGHDINMMGNATVRAPGARVSAVAASNPWEYAQKQAAHTLSPSTDGSRIYLDAASTIDVSGLNEVAVAATRNIVSVRMGANELADDPLLRDGFLHGQTVNIDVTRGSTLLNQSTLEAYQNNIGRGILEKLTVGGAIALSSNGDVITRAGSTQNVSGGSVAYQTARGQGTTKLLGADGRVYDVTSAPNDIQYVSFADTYSHVDTRWGTTTKVDASQQTLIAGYLQGADAGELDVQGPQIYLRGTMLGQTTPGIFQRSTASMPRAGAFVLGDSAAVQSLGFTNRDAPSVVLSDDVADDLGDFDSLSDGTPRVGTTAISLNALGANGFNRFALYSNGGIAQAAGSAIVLPGNGSLILDGSAITLDGAIRMPSSTLNFKAENFLSTENLLADDVAAAAAATHPNAVTLGPSASFDVRGTWVNDSPLLNTQPGTAPLLLDGGSVTLQAYGDVVLGAHSQIDASGGGWINASNKLKAGNGGSISLRADVGTPSQQTVQSGIDLGGATLRAEGLGVGGKLSLTSAWVSVTVDGKVPPRAGEAAPAPDHPPAGRPGELALAPDFFTRGGFSQYSITGINGVTIGSAEGTAPVTLTPIQQNRVFTSDRLLQATGSEPRSFTTLTTLPPELRAPTSLSFASTASLATAPGLGNVTLNRGSAIVTDPGASVSLTARENLSVFGSIDAPAGRIVLQLAPGVATTGQDDDGYVAGQQLLLGPEARLSARGVAAIYSNTNALGYRQGSVLGGGSLELLAHKGSVVAQLGSVLDVSAADGIIDVVNHRGVTPTAVAGDAGSITVQARENIVLNSDLKALPASVPGAGGGDLTIGLDLFDLTSTLSYNNSATPDLRYPTDPLQVGAPVIDRNLTLTSVDKSHLANTLALGLGGLVSQDGTATLSTGAFAGGGFANVTVRSADILTLDDSLGGRFAATPLILSARASVTLDAQKLSAARGTQANVSAAYVGLGTQNFVTAGSATRSYSPAAGADGATLNVRADLIDIRGKSVLSGFERAAFDSSGDIRFGYGVVGGTAGNSGGQTDFVGWFKSTAALDFTAAQLYPVTNARFTINPTSDVDTGVSPPLDPRAAASYDYEPGAVQVHARAGASVPTVPLSALGSLTINAPSIEQGGVLRAPFGQITLNGIRGTDDTPGTVRLTAGSLTSVSADGQLIPFGSTQNGQTWVYPIDAGSTQLIDTLPARQVNLGGDDVALEAGAKLDLAGGGDLYAYEFIAGTGGSKDVLSAAADSYALVPTYSSGYVPIDHQYGTGSTLAPGRSVYLSGVPGLADGAYTLLPSRYALLPGAYSVRMAKANSDLLPGSALRQPDGSWLVAGRLGVAGTDILDSRTSSFIITPGSVVRTQSQYSESRANNFFSNAAIAARKVAANLPADAGQMQLSATTRLALDGTIAFAPGSFVSGKDASGKDIVTPGRGGNLAIEASRLKVVDQLGDDDGFLQITADSLNRLGANSLILGATRTATAEGDVLSVGADQVLVDRDASLRAPEIILAARQTVDLEGSLTSSGVLTGAPGALSVSGDGALLRLANSEQSLFTRTNVPESGLQGALTVGADATIARGTAAQPGSLILDAAADTRVLTGAAIDVPAISVSSSRISVGEVPDGTAGLSLTSQLLGNFSQLTDLTLHSYSTIDFYTGAAPVSLGTVRTTNGARVPELRNVTLDARGIGNFGAGNTTITAGSIALQNSNPAQDSPPFLAGPAGSGALTLDALSLGTSDSGQILLGGGTKDLRGFGGGVMLNAAGDIRGAGTGTLNVLDSGALTLAAARLTTDTGATQSIANAGAVTVSTSANAVAPAGLAAANLGGRLSISGTSIADSGRIALPAGSVSLRATQGDVSLGSGAVIDVSGVVRPYFDTYAAASGGLVSLAATGGSVVVGSGAIVDVSGATAPDGHTSSDAGSLRIAAGDGRFSLLGSIKGGAAAGRHHGNFTLDAGWLGEAPTGAANVDLGALAAKLAGGGFFGDVSIRDRNDTVVSVGSLKASRFELAADQGALIVNGLIDTHSGNPSTGDGGDISLWANGNLLIASGGALDASAGKPLGNAPARGGDITLSSVNGEINLASGSVLDLTGRRNLVSSTGAQIGTERTVDGQLHLRAGARIGAGGVLDDVAVGVVAGTVRSRHSIVIDAVQTFGATDPGLIAVGAVGANSDLALDAAAFESLRQSTLTYLGASPTLATRLGLAPDSVQLRPEIAVQGDGNITVSGVIDLNTWHLDGVPVDLSLRASGNLIFSGTLSDGFSNALGGTPPNWTLAGGDSTSYRLAAGADLAAANPLAFAHAGAGDVLLARNNLIRTGNGNIDVAAGGNIRLDTQTAVIYTAGVPALMSPDNFSAPAIQPGSAFSDPAYPVNGGDISFRAGGDVIGAPSTQLASNWLWRQGAVSNGGLATNTSWWIVFNQFQQGIGALGGGDISVRAAGNVTNLSAVIPTTGRLGGTAGTAPEMKNLFLEGGGNLLVEAGADVRSGVFHNDLGHTTIRAADSVISSLAAGDASRVASAAVLMVGDSSFDVTARKDVVLEAVTNSTAFPQSTSNQSAFGAARRKAYFYTYTPASALNVSSIGGDVILSNNATLVLNATRLLETTITPRSLLEVYPSMLNVAALSGDIGILGAMQMFPSQVGNVNLLAQGGITLAQTFQMLESDPALVAGVLNPFTLALSNAALNTPQLLPQTPLHALDTVPARIVAARGDITASNLITVPKAAQFVAGGDILNLNYLGKNLATSDVTLFQAGGSIRYDASRNPASGQLTSNSNGISVAGPGFVEALAGGTIDLGNGTGIVTTGRLNDVRLAGTGASLIAGAGFGRKADGSMREPAYDTFIDEYLKAQTAQSAAIYRESLVQYLASLFPQAPAATPATAVEELLKLPRIRQLPFLAQVLSAELSATGLAHNRDGSSYDRGYKAINTLFPRKEAGGTPLTYQGDINLFLSQLKTSQGGGIDLLAPGGAVVVGVPNPPAELTALKQNFGFTPPLAAESNLGILVLAQGSVRGFANGDFAVNQSRILTLQGGDIILWSSFGNIDAGKGATTAQGAPPPVVQTDSSGNVFVNPVGAVAGSGIGQLLTVPGIKAGLVNLIAPTGFVNAGDAGIRVAGDLNLAAVAVLNVGNIKVGGTATGVPVSDAGALSGALSGASALGDAGKNVAEQLSQNLSSANSFQQMTDALQPNFVIVRMFCLGVECDTR